jgi:hypothetical protein
MNRLKEREAQALAVTAEERENGNEDNPILYAESGPCRFRTLSFFFPEEDGVEIVEDLDNEEEITVNYFSDSGSVELTEGPLYDWAMERYYEDEGGSNE